MKPVAQFSNFDSVVVTGPGGLTQFACNLLSIYATEQGHIVHLTDLWDVENVELRPRFVGILQIASPGDYVPEEPASIADLRVAEVRVGDTRLQMVAREGDHVRRDRWFGRTLPEDQKTLVQMIRAGQIYVSFYERQIDTFPENDSFRACLEEGRAYIANRNELMERQLAKLEGAQP